MAGAGQVGAALALWIRLRKDKELSEMIKGALPVGIWVLRTIDLRCNTAIRPTIYYGMHRRRNRWGGYRRIVEYRRYRH